MAVTKIPVGNGLLLFLDIRCFNKHTFKFRLAGLLELLDCAIASCDEIAELGVASELAEFGSDVGDAGDVLGQVGLYVGFELHLATIDLN